MVGQKSSVADSDFLLWSLDCRTSLPTIILRRIAIPMCIPLSSAFAFDCALEARRVEAMDLKQAMMQRTLTEKTLVRNVERATV